MSDTKFRPDYVRAGGAAAALIIETSDLPLSFRELASHRCTLVRMFDLMLGERSEYPPNHVLFIRMTRLAEELLKAIKEIDSRLSLFTDADIDMREERLTDEDIPF